MATQPVGPVPDTTDVAVRARGLRVVRGGRRGVVVLDGLDLSVPAGCVVGLLGPSGSGKTTLMRAVVGVQAEVTGEVTVLGLPAGHARLRDRVAYVTQQPSVYADLSVEQNLTYLARLVGASSDDVARSLEAVELGALARRRVGVLSGGERSRVLLAAALLGRPELLVLDEPTVGLDPVLRRDLWDLFAHLASEGASLLVSSHVMDEARRCDHLLLLRDGRLLADEPVPALLARTSAPDVESAFLALVEDAPARAGRPPGGRTGEGAR
ncbi:ABC transporter ATP-binding protein [Cellulomonas sp. APG4]|uniref:ABC transporter ATP-binding protein n=1 Tax=Cellulomonas sp. APG4 TaxID=1538656 RepID=UPI001379EE6B|nr:ABC transporter ATP-binding protein [Cellulomonas sp. APG4]NCT91681.1 ABC transporter ATP-binding protein [Cellulomonas sp. APG4]